MEGSEGEAANRAHMAEDLESRRLRYGLILLITSVLIIMAMFIAVAIQFSNIFDSAGSVLSLITTSTTVIGTLVGFYFGAQAGAAGGARADAARQETVELAVGAARGAPPVPNGGQGPAPAPAAGSTAR